MHHALLYITIWCWFVFRFCTSAIVIKIHILPFCCFCIQHTQCICHISGVVMTQCICGIFFFFVPHFAMCRNLGHLFYHPVQYLEQPSPMQTVVYCFPNLAGPCQMLHSSHWIVLHSDVWYPVCSCMSHDNLCMLILCHPNDSMVKSAEALNGNIFLVLHGFCTFLYIVLPLVSSSWWHPIFFAISSLSKNEHFLCSAFVLLYWHPQFLLSLLMIELHHK